ncbi:MAG: HupE/UreJ family protein [Proteobacteria bacterium]|nr:HupE/UreJ family protein [Pseudomonadota bacterium]
MRSSKILITLLLAATSSTALAHPGHDVSNLAAGLMHPFSGADHLLAMIAVGIWAAQAGGRKVWLLPVTFMSMLAIGAGMATLWQSLPLVEAGIAASVLALGLFIALSLRLSVMLSVAVTALFGLLHGYAHGLELPYSASPLTYALGFLVATATLHLTGIWLGMRNTAVSKWSGYAIAFSGAYLLVNI